MKKVILILIILLIFSSTLTFASDDAPVLAIYTFEFSTTQGEGGWYYSEFINGDYADLNYNSSTSRWEGDGGSLIASRYMHPASGSDAAVRFEAPIKGMVRLKGSVYQSQTEASTQGDGIVAKILNNSGDEVWSNTVRGETPVDYDVTIAVREGDFLSFVVNGNQNTSYDATVWQPTVEYLGIDYVGEENNDVCFQKHGEEMRQLEYDEDNECFLADDGLAFISEEAVMPTNDYSLVKRYTIEEGGRYRVYVRLKAQDTRSEGYVVTVWRNSQMEWKQLIPDSQEGVVDIRMLSNTGDIIDIEIAAYNYAGYNYAEWECDVSKIFGSIDCEASTSTGDNYSVLSEQTLASLIGSSQGVNGVSFYSDQYGIINPMTYDASTKKWVSGISGDAGYISADGILAGRTGLPYTAITYVIEIAIDEAKTLKIKGDTSTLTDSKGVVTKVILNGKMLWSSRVGGERSLRWNEPYDITYFLNDMNVTAEVSPGDVLQFTFKKWLTEDETYSLSNVQNDIVNPNNISIYEITGDVLSKTTRWKLKNSLVIDTAENCAYINGDMKTVGMFVENGTTYIEAGFAAENIGNSSNSETRDVNGIVYVPLRSTAEENEKNVVWAADRVALIYDGIPLLYGYSELSEIDAALKGGDLFD